MDWFQIVFLMGLFFELTDFVLVKLVYYILDLLTASTWFINSIFVCRFPYSVRFTQAQNTKFNNPHDWNLTVFIEIIFRLSLENGNNLCILTHVRTLYMQLAKLYNCVKPFLLFLTAVLWIFYSVSKGSVWTNVTFHFQIASRFPPSYHQIS